jgi:hypothetical protein
MQKRNLRFLAYSLLGIMVSIAVFSFSAPSGADSFQIYLDKKLIVEDYVHLAKKVKTINIQAANHNSQLEVYYNHCGELGRSRTIVLKDNQNRILREFRFKDGNKFMTCKVSDFIDFKKKNPVPAINLYYSAQQSPEPRLLANILVNTTDKALAGK